MKFTFTIISLLFFLTSTAQITDSPEGHRQKMDRLTKTKADTTTIAVLIYEGMVLQDFAGPVEVFSKAEKLTRGKDKTFMVGFDQNTIHTENNLVEIKPEFTLESMPDSDYFIIPGADMPTIKKLEKDKRLQELIKKRGKEEGKKTVSICTAAYILANTGVLNGKNATTHYFVAEDFAEQFPKIKLIKNVRYVDAGNYITSSGVTSGIDTALYIVGTISGKQIQAMIARALQYNYSEKQQWPVAPNGMRYRSE